MSYYQKYRPHKISELDLVSVRESLQSVLENGKLSHAYLFVGPRGSGKTSTARILAKVVNCEKNQDKKIGFVEPCGECDACKSLDSGSSVDVLEIDAASSGLVDDIRDLREKVRLAPVHLPKKVYIIDEVHMVSNAGFNALLKTLEEPPKHVLFILCTTEGAKVPETIVSRCCRVNFPKASNKEIIFSLMKAVKGEGLDIDEEALVEIASATDGSFREGHKLLEQIAVSGKTIDAELVLEVLGIVGKQSIKKLLEAVEKRDSTKIVKMFVDMDKSGIKAPILAASLLTDLKLRLEERLINGDSVTDEMRLIDELVMATDKIKISPLPLLPLEIALLTVSIGDSGGGASRPKDLTPAHEDKADSVGNGTYAKNTIDEGNLEDKGNIVVQNYDGPLVDIDKVKTEWMDFLNVMSGSCGSLAGLLRLVSPVEVKGKSITLSVTSRFQQDMLEREVKKKMIEEQMAKVWGPMTFRCVLGEKDPPRTLLDFQDVNVEPVDDQVVEGKEVILAAEKIFGE